MVMKSEKIAVSIGVITIAAFVIGNAVMAITSNNNSGDISEPSNSQQDVIEQYIETETIIETIPYEIKTVNDDTVEYGKTVVKAEGVSGEKTYTYRVTYRGKVRVSRELVNDEITKQPVTKIIAKGTKVVWHCKDVTSFDRNSNNDNLCTSSVGEQRYVGDCAAVALDPYYRPGQSGASYYNGCAR